MKNGDVQHFPTLQETFISNPFSGDVEIRANKIGNLFDIDKTVLEMEIITLQNDSIFKSTSEFWKNSTFSSVKYLKKKYRSKITNSNLDSSIRAAISNYIPEFSKLAEKNQCQLSH
ncbi:SCAN domain-containing protein 3-like [Aphis craccivora]|uniref:SCAN domain-containing protein 3-like n=1 Tax=Aphis craccivora TaxID=307492 RepID=A0A6G0YDS2_APHCR|nr:SCAN domain-containing protein 3-like [Aphis craccivora]